MNDLNKKLILSFLIVFFLGTVALFTLREATESKFKISMYYLVFLVLN